MAAYSILGSSILPAGIKTWRIVDDDWVSLGPLKDGIVTATPQFDATDALMEKPHGMMVEASAKLLATGKTTVLAMLDKLANCQKHDLELIGSSATQGSYINLSAASTHCKWKFVIGGGPGQTRYIEIMVKRYYPLSSAGSAPVFEDVFASAVQSTQTAGGTDFTAWAPSNDTIWSSQCTNFYVRNTGETNWELPSAIKSDTKLELELLCGEDDQNGCYRHMNLVKATYDVTLLASDRAGIMLKLNDVAQSVSNDIRIDGIDGTQFTFADNLGLVPTFENKGPATGNQLVRVSGTGVIPLSSLDGIFV